MAHIHNLFLSLQLSFTVKHIIYVEGLGKSQDI